MSDETETGPAGASDRGGHPPGGAGVGSPFQARASFVKNWDWQSVISINRGACERGRAQHGINAETGGACAQEWEAIRSQVMTLAETRDRLRGFRSVAAVRFGRLRKGVPAWHGSCAAWGGLWTNKSRFRPR